MPVYKQPEGLLRRAVLSVLAQTFSDLRLIVVDDAGGMLEEIADITDPRLECLTLTENKGTYNAHSLTLARTTTPWWCPVDADDWLDPTRLQNMLSGAGKADVVLGGMVHRGIPRPPSYPPITIKGFPVRWSTTWAGGLWSAQWLRSVGGFSPGIRVAYDAFLQELAWRYATVALVSDVGYHYEPREGSLTHDPNTMMRSSLRESTHRQLLEFLVQIKSPAEARRMLSSEAPATLARGGGGLIAFAHELETSLGFRSVGLEEATSLLGAGIPVLTHAWNHTYATLARRYPGLLHTIWHSQWAGTDLMKERDYLADAIRAKKAGELASIFWLSENDCLLPFTTRIYPVWSPESLPTSTRPKVPGTVMIGPFGSYSSCCKGVIPAVVAAIGSQAKRIVVAGGGAKDREGLIKAFGDPRVEIVGDVSREQCADLLSEAEVLVQPSLTDTWAFLCLEAVNCRTPVLLSSAMSWSSSIPSWAVISATDTRAMVTAIDRCLDPAEAASLLETEQRVLGQLSVELTRKTREVLSEAGFKNMVDKPGGV
jgi:hypothetical protein